MITKKQRATLKAAITRLVKAEIAVSWIGAAEPDDDPLIEEDLRLAKNALDRAFDRITVLP